MPIRRCQIPYRLDLAGGWLDQPYVSKYHPGSVITLCIKNTHDFMVRGGIATSTRNHAIKIWKNKIPRNVEREILAKCLFGYENIPGKPYFTGSQDAIGMVYPGLNFSYYDGDYWPETMRHCLERETLDFMERVIRLVPVGPRPDDFDVMKRSYIDSLGVARLAGAADGLWDALSHGRLVERNIGEWITESYRAQIDMFPAMCTLEVQRVIDAHKSQAWGWKVTGAGGGGYVLFIVKRHIPCSIRIKVRRK